MRSTAWSPLIGSDSRSALGSGSDGGQAPGVRLGEPGADEHVLERAAEPLLGRQVAGDAHGAAASCAARGRARPARPPRRRRSRASRRARATSGRSRRHAVGDLEAEALEDRALLVVGRRRGRSRGRARSGRNVHDAARSGRPSWTSTEPVSSRAGEVDEQPAREHRGGLGRVRVDALLPLVRALGAQREALRGLEHPDRLEVRRLEQDLGASPPRPRTRGRP